MIDKPSHQSEFQDREARTSGPRPRQAVSLRAFLFGLVCALSMCAIMPYNDYYIAATYLSGNFFPIGAIGAVLVLTLLVNPVLIALKRRQSIFSPGEIITVWTMILVVAGIPSSGLMRYLIPHIVAPRYYVSPQNGWDPMIVSHLPSRLFVSDPFAVRAFFEGLKRGERIPWAAWVEPLCWWGLFVFLLFLAFFCLAALLRKQWVEHEHLSFPLVKLPVLLAESPEPGRKFNALLRSPLLWVGVGVVTALHATKGLHLFYPTIPDVSTVWHSSDFLTDKPWNGLNDMEFAVYPLVIGFAYLLSSEVALSLWFFYLVFKTQTMLGSMYAWDMNSTGTGWIMGPAFIAYEEAGGALMLTFWLLYAMRAHLKAVWRKAAFNDKDVDDSREPLSYRFALFGLAAAYLGMFLWLVLVAQMQAMIALGILIGSLMIFLMLSWLVAQGGLLFIQQAFAPSQLLTVLGGTTSFHAPSLAMASITEHVGWQDSREFMMPSLLNSFKASDETRLDSRKLTRALAVCVLGAVLISGAASIWLPYTHGGGTALRNHWMYIDAPQLSLSWTASQIQNPHGSLTGGILHMLGGALFVLILFLCRTYIPAFGLHPAGFLVAETYPMYTLWFSLLLGWLFKAPIVRYGGLQGYRRLLPFFLGLILGDCANALIWAVIGLTTHTGYSLLPG